MLHNCDALTLLDSTTDNTVQLIATDPPFFISTGRDGAGLGGDPWVPHIKTLADAVTWAGPVATRMYRVIARGGSCCVMASGQATAPWYLVMETAGFKWAATLNVLVNTGKPRVRKFGSLCYNVIWWTKPGAPHTFNHPTGGKSFYSNVLVVPQIPAAARHHVSEKPVALTDFLVRTLSNFAIDSLLNSDLVVDPFAGSGSTIVSANYLGRRWVGCEADPVIWQVAIDRLGSRAPELRDPIHFWINNRLVVVE